MMTAAITTMNRTHEEVARRLGEVRGANVMILDAHQVNSEPKMPAAARRSQANSTQEVPPTLWIF